MLHIIVIPNKMTQPASNSENWYFIHQINSKCKYEHPQFERDNTHT